MDMPIHKRLSITIFCARTYLTNDILSGAFDVGEEWCPQFTLNYKRYYSFLTQIFQYKIVNLER